MTTHLNQGTIILDNDPYVALWQDDAIASIGGFVKPGESVDEVVSHLQEHFPRPNRRAHPVPIKA